MASALVLSNFTNIPIHNQPSHARSAFTIGFFVYVGWDTPMVADSNKGSEKKRVDLIYAHSPQNYFSLDKKVFRAYIQDKRVLIL